MTLEKQVHNQELEIRKLGEELAAQNKDIEKIVNFINDTRIYIHAWRVQVRFNKD